MSFKIAPVKEVQGAVVIDQIEESGYFHIPLMIKFSREKIPQFIISCENFPNNFST